MVEIHLYGKLRNMSLDAASSQKGVFEINPKKGETIGLLLERLNIPVDDVYSLFVNHKLLAARSGMAMWLRHQQVNETPFDWDLNSPVKADDRIGLFGRDMAALVV